jgi:hypothetical protein
MSLSALFRGIPGGYKPEPAVKSIQQQIEQLNEYCVRYYSGKHSSLSMHPDVRRSMNIAHGICNAASWVQLAPCCSPRAGEEL